MNISEIENTIQELEAGETTFAACDKLASLYIVRNYLKNRTQGTVGGAVAKELSDILPEYKRYCDTKRRYQLFEVTQDAVLHAMAGLCKEIDEFMRTLYSSTDSPEERAYIIEEISRLQNLGSVQSQ